MEEKKVKRASIMITASLLIGAGFFLFLARGTPPDIEKNRIKTTAFIPYASNFHYRQTPNDCGPYSTAAVARVIKNNEIDAGEFSKKIRWRIPFKGTHPWGLEKQLKEHEISVETPNLRPLSDDAKILFLQQQLSQKKPIIILGEKNNFQHYMTLLGFNSSQDEFYAYDSYHDKKTNAPNLTVDDNGALPGNRTLSSKTLLSFWGKGGMFGFYRWYALVAS